MANCKEVCRFDAIIEDAQHSRFRIDPFACEGCGVCVAFCPVKAIDFPDSTCGECYVSSTRFGQMVHARLLPGAENSGKLVTWVRKKAREIAEKKQSDYLVVDGPPGIGCPVIASITGSDYIVAITEPSVSGRHDLQRVLALGKHFGIRIFVCVNKWESVHR